MPVPYGFGAGDFIAVGTLAWSVYKSCKAAPGSFENISAEVLSLHALLKEGEETLFNRPLSPTRVERLRLIKEGCDSVLVDLQRLVEKYESLGSQSKRTWDRMKWGKEDIAEIRARIISNITILTSFISTSQISVETKLDKFIQEFRQGKREASVVSLQTVDSLSADDRAVWRRIRKELEEIGISVAAFEANRNFIFDWFIRTIEAGAFEEEKGSDDSNERELQGDKEHDSHDTGWLIRHTETEIESEKSVNEDQLPPRQLLSQSVREEKPSFPKLSQSVRDEAPNLPKPSSKSLDQTVASTRPVPKKKAYVPRIAAVLAVLSRPRQRFIKAVEAGDFGKALKILKDEASFQLLDMETLNEALCATCQVDGHNPRPLLTELIARGSDVDWISNDYDESTPLWSSAANGSLDTVQFLIDNGANVNYTGSDRTRRFLFEDGAYVFAPRATLVAPGAASENSLAMLRLLLSAGVNPNIWYTIRGDTSIDGISYTYYHEFTLIQEAASLGAVAAMELLLEYGAEIDAVSPDHGTALMLALSGRQVDAARFLLANGADPDFLAESPKSYRTLNAREYRSPIDAAVFGKDSSLVRLLLDRGARVEDLTLRVAEYEMYDKEDREIVTMLRYALARG